MALEDAKTQIDHAFTRDDLKGPSFENVFGGAASFLRRKYTKDLRGVDGGRLANAKYVEQLTPLLVNINRIYKVHAGIKIVGV